MTAFPHSELADIVGHNNVLTATADLSGYNQDGRGAAGAAQAVVRPRTTDEVAAVIACASRSGLQIVPQGARTGLVGAGAADPSATALILSLERMIEPLDVDPVNRTARVGAGVTLSRLNAAAGEHGLFFPIDLGADPTVGGMISANTGGARFLRYGDVRRNTLAIELVTSRSDAQVMRLGRDCWKQNDSIDLKQMVIGASGSFGVVTAATLALQPRPMNRLTALLAVCDTAVVDTVLMRFERQCGMLITAFEGLSAAAYEAALRHVPRIRRPFPADAAYPYFLLVELSCGPALDVGILEEAFATVLEPFMSDAGAPIRDVVLDQHDDLWALRHAIPEGLRATGTVIGCDIALKRGDVFRLRKVVAAEIVSELPSIRLCDFGHVGDGGLHLNMVWPHEAGPVPSDLPDTTRARVAEIVVNRFGGTFSAEHGIGPRNLDIYRRFTAPNTLQLSADVQRVFAPVSIGRIDFGPGVDSA